MDYTDRLQTFVVGDSTCSALMYPLCIGAQSHSTLSGSSFSSDLSCTDSCCSPLSDLLCCQHDKYNSLVLHLNICGLHQTIQGTGLTSKSGSYANYSEFCVHCCMIHTIILQIMTMNHIYLHYSPQFYF